MAWNWVEVKESPRLESLTITVHPPAYTGLPTRPAERHLEVLAGTGIEIGATTSKPIRAARILQDRGEPIEATVLMNAAGQGRRAFHVDPKQWTATQSGPYRFELVDESGLAGILGPWNLRVDADAPPSISWQRPSDDLFVLPRAVVPIELVVKDDFAIQRVDLIYDRNDKSESERAARPKEPPIELYLGPEKPPAIPSTVDPNARGESRVVTYSWALAPLQLPAGALLTVRAEASDYRPGVGQTIGPRHISLITVDELEARLADRQLQIVRQFERALTIERKTREDVRQVQIQLRDAGALTGRDRNTLQTAEPNQRSVSKILGNSAEGARPLIEAILSEIEINGLETSEMRETMIRLAAELKRLSTGSLNIAESELTSAAKTVESISPERDSESKSILPLNARQVQTVSRSLAAASGGQDDVIATLERLIGELSGKADYRRFAKLIAELREEQLAHEKSARAEIGIETRPLEPNELSRAQCANLNKAAAGESAIAGRFEKIEQSMDQLAKQMREDKDPMAGTLADAVDLCRQFSIGMNMRQTAADFSENRVGLRSTAKSRLPNGFSRCSTYCATRANAGRGNWSTN